MASSARVTPHDDPPWAVGAVLMGASVSVGRVLGTPVRLHWSALIIAGVLTVSLADALGSVAAIAGVIAFLVSITVHEIGHAAVARRFGIATTSIDIWALGGLARLEREATTPRAEAAIAIAGPVGSLMMSGLFTVVWWTGRERLGWEWSALAGWLAVVNVALALFNMLPGSPLDGGRVVRAWRWSRHGDRSRAVRESARVGVVVGWAVCALGLLGVLVGYRAPMVVVAGVLIATTARMEIAAADLRDGVADIAVSTLLWWGVATVPASATVDEALQQRTRFGSAGVVAVIDEDGMLVGAAMERSLEEIPDEATDVVTMSDLMVGVGDLTYVEPGDTLDSILGRLNIRRPIVVVGDSAHIAAAVPPRALRDALGV